MRILCKALLWEAWMQFVASSILASLGFVLTITFFQASVVLVILGLGMATIGIRLLLETWGNLRLSNNRIYRLLCHQPEEIVWIYTVVTKRMPFGFSFSHQGTIFFKLSNGEELSVALPASKVKLISRYLNRLVPHATFGYSTEKDRTFQISPDLLRRDKLN